ncbi:MAG TPA: carboxypeptidase-like regulatory domain-containing protein [Archangium sp.]|nr:carboxypeptidase-like regulatory domain-containing protein [Archangium sp.]
MARSSWTSGPTAAPPETRGPLSIQGQVLGPEGPVPGALVVALAPASPEWLSRLPPPDEHLWGRGRFCDQRPDTLKLLALAAEHRGTRATPPVHATTDAQGNFRLVGLEAGTFVLWAESGEDVGVLWDVAAGSQDVEVRVVLGQSFSGVVHDEQGGAVAGVRVTTLLRDLGRFVETTTDAEGRFLLGPLPWGSSTVFLSKEGFPPMRLKFDGRGPDGNAVTLFAAGRLAGRVLDERGPVQGATVQLEEKAHVPPVTTDARGHFELEGPCPGHYGLTASHEGRYGEQRVEVWQTWESAPVELVLGAALRLSGRVTDPAGRPIEGAEVSVSRAEPVRSRTVRTDSRGGFLLEPLAPGTYGMSVQAARYVRGEVPPRLLEASEEMQLTLKEAWLVEGRTVDEAGAPVEGVSLRLVRAEAGPPGPSVSTARSGAQGAFVLEAPEPGPWRVLASHPDFFEEELQASAPSREARLVMRGGASLEVELVDGMGRPVSRANILAERGGASRTLTTGAGGGAVFRGLEPGRYTVRALPPVGWGVFAEAEVEVQGVEARKVRLQLEEGWTLSGQVVDAGGHPLEGASLLVVQKGESGRPDLSARAKSGPGGGFSLAHLAEGSWMVGVSLHGYALDAEASSGVEESRGNGFRVLVSPSSTGVRLVMMRNLLGEARGRVVREDGRPITSFWVRGTRVNHPEGRFSVPVQEERVGFYAPGFSEAHRDVKVRGGEVIELGDVVLAEGRTVRGRVLEAGTSAPVAGARVGGGGWLGPAVLTLSDGSFTGRVVGKWWMSVSHPDYPPMRMTLEEGQEEVTVVLEPGARLEGRIAPAGVPVRSGTVQLRSEQGAVLATTGFWEGRYSLRALPAGRYLVQVVARSDEGPAPLFPLRRVELAAGGRVTLDFTEQVTGASVEVLVPERNIEVHLLPGDLPLMGPKDGLYSKLGSGLMGRSVREGVRFFPRVPEGHYTLFAMRRDEDVTEVHREELEVPAEGQVLFSLLPQWSLYDD